MRRWCACAAQAAPRCAVTHRPPAIFRHAATLCARPPATGQLVYQLDIYNGLDSWTAMWTQVHGVAELIRNITSAPDAAAEYVLVCHSQVRHAAAAPHNPTLARSACNVR